MHIKRIKKGNAVYLAEYETYREGEKIKTKFIRYLGKESDEKKVPLPKKSAHIQTPVYPEHSKRAGDITLFWHIAENELHMPRIINSICCGDGQIDGKSPGKILTAWAINKALNPISATNLGEWVTSSVLPDLSGLPGEYFTDSAFYSALDRVCFRDTTADGFTDFSTLICDELYSLWRFNHPLPENNTEILAYDLTPVLIFGTGDDLGEKGYNSKHVNKKQINLCILVSKFDKAPVSYFLLPGNFNSMSSVKELLVQLIDMSFEPGTLIWDRGNTSQDSIRDIEALGWNLICGVQKISDEAMLKIMETDVTPHFSNRVKSTNKSALYAMRAPGKLFGKENAGIVYVNIAKRMETIDSRYELLMGINADLSDLNENLEKFKKSDIELKISEIVGEYKQFFIILLQKQDKRYSLKWTLNEETILQAEALDGKYLLYSTDSSLSPSEVVKEYLGKDFVEKTFNTLKSHLKIAPVRHWKNHRIRAIFFVAMLALWLRVVYNHRIAQISKNEKIYEFDEFLRRLKRVEYVEIETENQEKAYWYLNLTDKMVGQLKKMGFTNLFKENRLSHL
jgi:hypothetical protein